MESGVHIVEAKFKSPKKSKKTCDESGTDAYELVTRVGHTLAL